MSKNVGETRVFLHAPTVHWRLTDEAQEEVKGDGDSKKILDTKQITYGIWEFQLQPARQQDTARIPLRMQSTELLFDVQN